jgi:hypothetical protein
MNVSTISEENLQEKASSELIILTLSTALWRFSYMLRLELIYIV